MFIIVPGKAMQFTTVTLQSVQWNLCIPGTLGQINVS